MVWSAILPFAGAAAGGILGGIFGGGKKTGTGKASVKAMDIHERSFARGIQNVNTYGQSYLDSFRSVSPIFGALESRVLGDLDDEGRNARLEQAFADRLNQQQVAMGLGRSPTAALRTSFAGLQFGEQMRQQAFNNASSFQGAFGQPLAAALFGAASPNLSGEAFALQGLALAAGQAAAQNQSIFGGIQQGLGFGSLFGGGFFGGGGGGGGGYGTISRNIAGGTAIMPSNYRSVGGGQLVL